MIKDGFRKLRMIEDDQKWLKMIEKTTKNVKDDL